MIMWRNDRTGGDHPVRDLCVTKSERQVVCSSLRAPNNAITDLGIDLSGSSCPIRTTTTWDNGYGPLCVVRFFRKLFRRRSSEMRAGWGWAGYVTGLFSVAPASRPVSQRAGVPRAMAQDPFVLRI